MKILTGFPGEETSNKNLVIEFVIIYVLCANLCT